MAAAVALWVEGPAGHQHQGLGVVGVGAVGGGLGEIAGAEGEGVEVVEGVKTDRGEESLAHRVAAKTFYRLISEATHIDMTRASDFKLLDRKAVNVLLSMREKRAFFRALSSWIGFRTAEVPYEVRERAAGDLDLLIGVFSLPLAKRRDELFHLRLRFGFFRLGQQHARLDVHQMRRHRDKLAGNLHVHALALVEPGKILLQNRRDADVLNFYFIFAQQKQNDIQRTVKILQRLLRVYYILQVILGLFHALPSVLWNPQTMALGRV